MISKDITFCLSDCNDETCIRHHKNAGVGIHSYAFLKDSLDCPKFKEEVSDLVKQGVEVHNNEYSLNDWMYN